MEVLLLELLLSESAMSALASAGCARGPMEAAGIEGLLVSSATTQHQLSPWPNIFVYRTMAKRLLFVGTQSVLALTGCAGGLVESAGLEGLLVSFAMETASSDVVTY